MHLFNLFNVYLPTFLSKEDTRAKELFDNIEKLRVKFEAIERPTLELEYSNEAELSTDGEESPSSENLEENHLKTPEAANSPESKKIEHPDSPSTKSKQVLAPEAELENLESEFGKVDQDYSADEIGGWEFDELEKELTSDETTSNK